MAAANAFYAHTETMNNYVAIKQFAVNSVLFEITLLHLRNMMVNNRQLKAGVARTS